MATPTPAENISNDVIIVVGPGVVIAICGLLIYWLRSRGQKDKDKPKD